MGRIGSSPLLGSAIRTPTSVRAPQRSVWTMGMPFGWRAGVRIGRDWVSADDRLWGISFLTAVYSDVLVNGFVASGVGGADTTLESDEGKVRVLGQLRAKVTVREGISYYGQAEVRGGADYIGVGGKVGVRYEW